jgi:hypothetical protein
MATELCFSRIEELMKLRGKDNRKQLKNGKKKFFFPF